MNMKPRHLLLLLLPLLVHGWTLPISSSSITTTTTTKTSNLKINRHTQLNAKNPKRAYSQKTKKKGGTTKGKSSTTTNAGLKGFGSTTTSSTASKISVPIDRSRSAMDFYSYLESRGAGANLKRVALGFFPFDTNNKDTDNIIPKNGEGALRGVVALTKIRKGETIIEIPYEAAWNLGREGSDPTVPGVLVLDEYCRWTNAAAATTSGDTTEQDLQSGPYLAMLPPYRSLDVLGSTDFFSDAALEALQSPHIVQETLRRRKRTMERFQTDVEPHFLPSLTLTHDEQQQQQQQQQPYQWTDGTSVTEEHLRWAVWLVTSRVLTVQGAAGTDESYRLMIPLIDMCNHDRDSSHVLTGRAVPGGSLKVVAGKTVEVGEQVTIVYGGGVSGNDRFVQDYGFLDSGGGSSSSSAGWGSIPEAYMITAKILMGTRRIFEGSGARNGRPTLMPLDERERALEALEETTLEDDLEILEKEGEMMQADVKCAVEYRVGVKKALRALGYGLVTDVP